MISSTDNSCQQTTCVQEHCKPLAEKVVCVIEKICLAALAAFAAMKDAYLFVPSFVAGMAIGLIWGGTFQPSCDGHHHHDSVCSNGFMEHLTGVQLPWGIALAANAAILAAHVDEHAMVFVPIVGVTTGIYAGAVLRSPLRSFGHKVVAVVRAPIDRYMQSFSAVFIQ